MVRHHVCKAIKDLSPADSLVSIAGLVVNSSDSSFILDDGTGQVVVFMKPPVNMNFVKVFGELLHDESGFQLRGTVLQDLSKIDKLLYKKVNSLIRGDALNGQ